MTNDKSLRCFLSEPHVKLISEILKARDARVRSLSPRLVADKDTTMSTTALSRPDVAEYAPFYAGYIALVPEGDIVDVLEEQRKEVVALLGDTSEDEGDTRHPPYTWSIKEVIG